MSMNRTYVSLNNLTLFWAAAKQYIDSLKVNDIEFGSDKHISISGSDILVGGTDSYKDLSVQGAIDALSNNDTQLGQRINIIETTYVKSLSINGNDGINVTINSEGDNPANGDVVVSISGSNLNERISEIESEYVKSIDVKDKDDSGNSYVTAEVSGSGGALTITIDDSKITAALDKTTDLSSQEFAVNGKNFYQDEDHNIILVAGDIKHNSDDTGTNGSTVYQEIETIKASYVKSITGDTNNDYVNISFSPANGEVVATIDEANLAAKLTEISNKANEVRNATDIPYSSDSDTTSTYAKVNSIEQTLTEHINTYNSHLTTQDTRDDGQDEKIAENTRKIGVIESGYVTSFGGKTGAITIDEDASSAGSIKFTMSNNELSGVVQGLGGLAYDNAEAYTKAQIEAIFG